MSDKKKIPTTDIQKARQRILQSQLSKEKLPEDVLATRVISQSGLFDVAYYLGTNPDVAISGIDPVLHYVQHGAAESRNPAPWFDGKFYLEENKDVDISGVNPFFHFIMNGYDEGRRPNSAIQKKKIVIKRGYDYNKTVHPAFYPFELKLWYSRVMNKRLYLENPLTFNEKIQWMKLYDNNPLKTRLADKYLVREYVKEKIGEEYLIPLLGAWDRFDDINFDSFPDQFVLKANHGSGWNIIVSDKQKFDIGEAREKFHIWMSRNFSFVNGFEMHYKNIKPVIVAEKFIKKLNSNLFDYRFFMFHGNLHHIWVDVKSGTPDHKRAIYTKDWIQVDCDVTWPRLVHGAAKPLKLNEMINLSEILSKGFKHVRVDFYEVDNKIYFGEMTFSSLSGIGKWSKERHNKIYGDLIKI